MNTTWYYIGIIVAVIAIVWALNVLLRKPHFRNHLENSPVENDETTGKPILPRHLRDENAQNAMAGTAVVENTTIDAQATSTKPDANATTDDKKAEMTAQELLNDWLSAKDARAADNKVAEQAHASTPDTIGDEKDIASTPETVDTQGEKDQVTSENSESKVELVALHSPSDAQTEDSNHTENDADIFAQHVSEHAQQQQSSLSSAEEMITLYIYPHKPELTNEKLIKLLKNHGLRFGEMACFHRYEYREGQPPVVMFSALKLDENANPTGFDLDDVADKMVSGLALFIALPHEDAVKAFDMLASTAVIIANEIEGSIFDENFSDFSHEVRNQWREYVISRA